MLMIKIEYPTICISTNKRREEGSCVLCHCLHHLKATGAATEEATWSLHTLYS